MVKTPRTRHSRTGKDPVTIDLAPDEVSRVEAAGPKPETKAGPEKPASESGPQDRPAGESTGEAVKDAPKAEPAAGSAFGRQGAKAEPSEPGKEEAPKKKEEAAKAAGPAQPAAPAAQPRKGGGFVAGLVAGLAGGVAALAIAAGLQFSGLLPGVTPAPAPHATDQVPDHGPAIAALESELAGLREEIAALSAAGNGGGDAALAARVEGIEERVSALASGLDAVRGEVADIAARPEGEAPAAPVDLGPIEERIAAFEAALTGLREGMASAAALAAVEDGLAALRAEIAEGREGQSQAAARLDALEAEIATLSGRVDEQAEAPATAIIIAASSLKAAIDRGTPFTTELDTYAALVPDAPQLEELRALAAAGVPTRAQISAESDAAANAMIAASRPVDPEAGIVDRLMGSMMGLVQVRPIGMVEGEGVPEIAARLDAAVRAGDYERAIAEYETLPVEARAAGEAFIAKVRARHAADRLVDAALAAALKA